MKQLSSKDYDLSGSRCFRQISHFIRNPALTRCSSSISFINLLGQQTCPVWLFLGPSTSNIQMLLFLSGLPRSRHMEDTLLFHLLLALRDGPIRTCPNGSLLRGQWRKVTENLTNKKCLSNEMTLKLTQAPSKRFCNQRNWFTGVLSSIYTCPTSATCLHAPEAVDVCSRAFWTAWRGRWNCDLDGYSHKVCAYI